MENQPTGPVMDVTAPPPKTSAEPIEVVTAPPYDASEYAETDTPEVQNPEKTKDAKTEAKTDKKQDKQKAITQQKNSSPSSNVGLAIIATVVIVIGLAAIATYAYLNQNS